MRAPAVLALVAALAGCAVPSGSSGGYRVAGALLLASGVSTAAGTTIYASAASSAGIETTETIAVPVILAAGLAIAGIVLLGAREASEAESPDSRPLWRAPLMLGTRTVTTAGPRPPAPTGPVRTPLFEVPAPTVSSG